MKRLYQEKSFIQFNQRRSNRIMRRKSRIKRRQKHFKLEGKLIKRKPYKIKAPDILSIVYNPNQTIDFISEISSSIKKSKMIFIDLKYVTDLTPDAIIYLLVLLKEAKLKNILIRGNAPENSKAFSIFVYSGFYDFVNSGLKKLKTPETQNILKIRSGKNVDGTEVENIQNYLQEHVHNIKEEQLRALYSILIECMSNTNEYAGKEIGDKYWWTMALHDNKSDKVLFAFVDNGVGIPSTVKKNWMDSSTDAEILKKAASGKYQMSGSKKKTRNKGLPQIRAYHDNGLIQHLAIVSNHGYYSADNDTKIIEIPFTGTLIAWEFV